MKRLVKPTLFFLPAAAALAFYGILATVSGFGAIDPMVWIGAILALAAGMLMTQGRAWGAAAGMAVGVWVIAHGLDYHGQVIPEWPFGVGLLVYYLGACLLCWWWLSGSWRSG